MNQLTQTTDLMHQLRYQALFDALRTSLDCKNTANSKNNQETSNTSNCDPTLQSFLSIQMKVIAAAQLLRELSQQQCQQYNNTSESVKEETVEKTVKEAVEKTVKKTVEKTAVTNVEKVVFYYSILNLKKFIVLTITIYSIKVTKLIVSYLIAPKQFFLSILTEGVWIQN